MTFSRTRPGWRRRWLPAGIWLALLSGCMGHGDSPPTRVALWRHVRANGYALPASGSLDHLTDGLLRDLASPDSELRDELAYRTLAAWIEGGRYRPDQLRRIARASTRVLERTPSGTPDAVFERSFLALALALVVDADNRQRFLAPSEVQAFLDTALAYLAAEVDARGYVPGKGWAHAIAHIGDLLESLASSRHVDRAGLERILRGVAAKVTAPVDEVYLSGEADRLAIAIASALRRGVIEPGFVREWAVELGGGQGRWILAHHDRARSRARANTKMLLVDLHTRLSASNGGPVGAELASAVRDGIETLAAHGPAVLPLPGGLAYPNGIAVASDGAIFVGSMVSGRVVRRRAGSTTWDTLFAGSGEVFASGSLRLDERRGLLWGTSPDLVGTRPARIFALDVASGGLRHVLRIPDGGFGNDLALDDAGGVYVTDSSRARVLYLAPGAARFVTVAEDARFRAGPDAFGPAGIALAADGSLVVGLFSAGELFRILPDRGSGATIEAIALPRRLENPDGMAFGPDGRLLVVEGAHTTGAGKLLAIELGSSSEPGAIEVVADGLATPVNVTTREGWVWVSEISDASGRFQVRAYAYPYRARAISPTLDRGGVSEQDRSSRPAG